MFNLQERTVNRFIQTVLTLGVLLAMAQPLSAQELPFDPESCGYACSAKDVIITNPYLSSDLQGTPLETCDGTSGETFTAYISFTFENTTGNLRYTPMIQANLNNGGVITQFSSCFSNIEANTSRIYTLPIPYSFNCGDEVSLENIWMGWNVTSKTCDDISGASGCNKLIPSGKCGDYNNIPIYIKMEVETPAELGEENTASRCGDGIDNDGDGIIDCDESSCASFDSCNYTTTTSGQEGGLESNSRLIEKIAKRQYNRSKSPEAQLPVNRAENILNRNALRNQLGAKVASMSELFPEGSLIGSEAYISSPDDLSALTNAREIFSIDYFQGESRRAAILATRTIQGVYEHTKVICDRVDGTRLTGVWKSEMENTPGMIIAKLERPGGAVEYASSFSIRQANGEVAAIEQFWNVSEYTKDESFMNFQVWASDPLALEQLITDILKRLKESSNASLAFTIGEVPALRVIGQKYNNQTLAVELANPAGLRSVKVFGTQRRTESDNEEIFEWEVPLSGEANEILRLDTGGVYSLGLSFQAQGGTPDTVFFADGVWGLDVQPELNTVNFSVFQEYTSEFENDWYLERGVTLQGTIDESLAWYRAVRNTFTSVSIEAYKGLALRTNSQTDLELEVVLSQPGLAWEDLPRTMLSVASGEQQHYIDLEELTGLANPTTNMIVFRVQNTTDQQVAIRLTVDQLRFTAEEKPQAHWSEGLTIKTEELRLFPNPARERTEVIFESDRTGEASYTVFNPKEQKGSGTFSIEKGLNRKELTLHGYSPGLYWIELSLPNGQLLRTRFVVY